MTPAELAARGLRIRPLAFGDADRNGGFHASFELGAGFSGYYDITQQNYGLASVQFGFYCHEFGGSEIWKGPFADAIAAANAHHAAQIAAMIERTE